MALDVRIRSLLVSAKTCQKVFEANITTQVIERHIIRNLEEIFSPLVVGRWAEADLSGIASEPAATMRQREFLEDRISKLTDGHRILRQVMKSTSV